LYKDVFKGIGMRQRRFIEATTYSTSSRRFLKPNKLTLIEILMFMLTVLWWKTFGDVTAYAELWILTIFCLNI